MPRAPRPPLTVTFSACVFSYSPDGFRMVYAAVPSHRWVHVEDRLTATSGHDPVTLRRTWRCVTCEFEWSVEGEPTRAYLDGGLLAGLR